METILTGAELLTELKRVQGGFTWRVTRKGCIRGSLKKAADRRLFDPVTAVVYVRTGEFFSEGHWTEAAAAIGLEYSGCAEIVAASNYEWDPSCRQGELRRQILDSLMPEMKYENTNESSRALANAFLRSTRKRSPDTH